MILTTFPNDIRNYLTDAMVELAIDSESISFWEVSDYGIFVLLTERFYKTLHYRKAEPLEFITRRANGILPHKNSYADSRTFTSLIIDHFHKHELNPHIIDIGGYIGRFSLESALLCQERGKHIPIYCLEPGLTGNIINANFAANGVSQLVSLRNEAASDEDGTAVYKYAPDVLISGRICSFPSASKHRTVKTIRLDTLINEIGCTEAAIIKIDTEGHEPNVMAGLGDIVNTLPAIYIIEFWPDTLKETVNNVPYDEFIEDNFIVLNIRSSLYPSYYRKINNIRQFASDFNEEEGNIDLLFISRTVPDAHKLELALMGLA